MLVADVMTENPVTVRRDATVKEALVLLAHHHVTSLPVVEPDTTIVGVVSEADLIRESVPTDPRAQILPAPPPLVPPAYVEDVFTPHAITVHMHDDLAHAVDLMTSTSVKSLPVVDEHGHVVGVIARSDVVQMLARPDSAIEADLDDLLRSVGHADWLVDVTDGVVDVSGPAGRAERSLADTVARTVAGVVEVRVDP